MLHDPQRLLRLLNNPTYPVQLVIAGKAHPNDGPGQDLIKQWINFIRDNGAHTPIMFLSDYDMHVAENLVQGVDVWINTPRRPWEASGTSGMKVLVNGGINLSELDGWWAEAYSPEVGWAIGDGKEHGDDPAWDAMQSEQLFDILENEVIPQFYDRNEKGIPTRWIERMRESMAQLTPRFSADRTVREYTESHYLPAAKAYQARVANNGKVGKQISTLLNSLNQHWGEMRFGELSVKSTDEQHEFDVKVDFGAVNPDTVQVQLFADGKNGDVPTVAEMKLVRKPKGKERGYCYKVTVPSSRQASDYTPRIIPCFEGLSVPLETNLILWQR